MKSYISVIPPRPPRILLLDGHDDPVHPVILYGVYNFIKKAFSSKSTSTSWICNFLMDKKLFLFLSYLPKYLIKYLLESIY